MGNNEYIQANGGRGTVGRKDENRISRGFVVKVCTPLQHVALYRVAYRQSLVHSRTSVDRRPASERRVSIRREYCVIAAA